MILYKGFDKEEHLDCFVNGDIRFTLLKAYREKENTISSDIDELIYRSLQNGVKETKELGNNVYGLCLTTHLCSAAKFGKYIAQIIDVDIFLSEIKKQIIDKNIRTYGELLFDNVMYTKGLELNKFKHTEYIKNIIFQKSPEFLDENEYRIAFILNEKQTNSIDKVITVKVSNSKFINKISLL